MASNVKMEIRGFDKVVAQLRARAAAARKGGDPRVTVGYTASYATYVHEDMEAFHPVGQAKFLEQPARQLHDVLAEVAVAQLKAGRTLAQALVAAGLRLQRESQKLCPVLTGVLKNSAFTRLE